MGNIRIAHLSDAQTIIDIAYATWPIAYAFINSPAQIEFMLAKYYDLDVVTEQLNNPSHIFLVFESNDKMIMGYAHAHPANNEHEYYLSKLYVLPQAQGMGIGQQLLHFLEQTLINKGLSSLSLNVNRRNPAVVFYKKLGFEIRAELDIPLDKYILDDYIMGKALRRST